ncbi:type I-C CRISPR-associated protein Cas8c/Csd1 [Hydrogenophaga electricum]|uniref:Type I-C CRISPR-associated protein Cas8c/Csd1 n=1 Tax=Hydrogenophaga electricum TaxID=1230953 RepID=A0ABQ6C354_9BURK|nr:type I-C CRISPR-associated protein Cas8c/Csd1 [Hydrogenophaga electricum]GLS12756.1 type I-C CRISPR-associated protein Cas8c/Csd1 [Hydrogenophaga electricum]
MILQALYDYYLRRQADVDPARRLPAYGLEQKEIGFILEVDESGQLHAIIDARQMSGKKKIGTSYLVPKGVKKTSGIAANLLWDNAEYVLALPDAKKMELARSKGGADEYLARLVEMQQAFRDRISTLPERAQSDAGLRGVLAFLDANPAEQLTLFAAHAEISASNPVLTFRLVDDTALVCQRPGVAPHLVADAPAWEATEERDGAKAMCLITGDTLPVERLHTAIKGVWGAQTSGANIVSFNLDAFNSYGKNQGANAPVSQAAAFAYTTALNALLVRDSDQRVQIGDASTVFWAQKPDALEHELAALLGGGDNPDAHTQQVKALFDSVHSGGFTGARGDNAFYVLGLAPNAARISVRFWHAAPLHVIAERIAAWFDDLSLVRGPNDPEFPSLFRLLTAVALQGKADNIPPSLGGDLIRSIFTGAPYPTTWLNAAVQRCRAEQQVTYMRAAAIKAYLNRSLTTSDSQPREIQPMLDIESLSTAYRLGRLFATLEKIQEEASPGLNATIRERYYGAASSTPVAVFTTLMRLKNHHLAKFQSKGRAVNFEKLLAEIMSGISDFPVHMNLPDQGRFAIGYYHQRQDFFTKRESAETESTAQTETAH